MEAPVYALDKAGEKAGINTGPIKMCWDPDLRKQDP